MSTDFKKHISINNEIRFGKPCIVGTRIAVVDILQWLASGISFEEILLNHIELNMVKLRAALYFAAHREEITKIISD